MPNTNATTKHFKSYFTIYLKIVSTNDLELQYLTVNYVSISSYNNHNIVGLFIYFLELFQMYHTIVL